MARIDDINVLLGLQSLILEQIRAIYGPKHIPKATFSIITSRFEVGGTTIQAIMYPQPGLSSEWKLLVEGAAAVSTQQAMEMLYKKSQEEANDITERMGVGYVYDGVGLKDEDEV